jgi:hypothetical protein
MVCSLLLGSHNVDYIEWSEFVKIRDMLLVVKAESSTAANIQVRAA